MERITDIILLGISEVILIIVDIIGICYIIYDKYKNVK